MLAYDYVVEYGASVLGQLSWFKLAHMYRLTRAVAVPIDFDALPNEQLRQEIEVVEEVWVFCLCLFLISFAGCMLLLLLFFELALHGELKIRHVSCVLQNC